MGGMGYDIALYLIQKGTKWNDEDLVTKLLIEVPKLAQDIVIIPNSIRQYFDPPLIIQLIEEFGFGEIEDHQTCFVNLMRYNIAGAERFAHPMGL